MHKKKDKLKKFILKIINVFHIYSSSLEAGASFDTFKEYNPFVMQRSAGFGLRVFMPAFGLLGIDFAHGFDAIPGFTNPNGWETHFIIGQQF